MRALACCLALLVAISAAALPGDVAPVGAPDGIVDVSDVLLALSMSVDTADIDLNADVSPANPFGSAVVVIGDGAIDVGDVLLILRVAVGLEILAGGIDLEGDEILLQLRAVVFGLDGLRALVSDALTLEELPPLNTPTEADCTVGGTTTTTLGLSAQTILADACDTGEFVIDGELSRTGSLLDPVLDFAADLELSHDDGDLVMIGTIALETDVEIEPDLLGTGISGFLEVSSTYPEATDFTLEIDLVDPQGEDGLRGTMWASVAGGAAIEIVFDGSSTAIATVELPSETRTYEVDLETGAITELP